MRQLTRRIAAWAFAALAAGPALAQEPVKIGFITKLIYPLVSGL